ncbi:RND family efflux transporter MFP subunit [Candidatus Nitrosoglobus terrae]|uniref:RND family efflux transporter MFP subunit n=1 Tax=Candidatus Nitrosoglobus terrae TaxID=1630141 RepID=A0A1Q2SND8_9GAMM|nr:efflux RND transporter periplasmic adaptor subunit [Candidatus Nitrosoglobus terrae]BAW80617.1 RND family efflux transporter MFP subunit [Candidatus Nitrosoglobus terrae]
MIRFIRLFTINATLLGLGIIIGLQLQPLAYPQQAVPKPVHPQLPYRSGPFQIDVTIAPQTPKVGKNTLTLQLQDSKGNPVANASIKATATMPAMGSMAAMPIPIEMTAIRQGLYQGTFNLPMGGSWPLTLEITTSAGKAQLSFDMVTGRLGLQLISGAIAQDKKQQAMKAEEVPSNAIMVDSHRRQLIGVTTDKVTYQHLTHTIRAVGLVIYDETRLVDVALKFNAWIGNLYVDYVGAPVEKGKPLFTVYGPELLATQQEYLELKHHHEQGTHSKALLTASRKRLSLWDMTASEITALAQRGTPNDYVPIHAPRSGIVITKNIVEGTARQAGETLMRIADLSQVWVEAEVYEDEVPLIQLGMPATVTLPYLPNRIFKAKVDYIYPYLQNTTRTGRIRLILPNPMGILKPNMYAEVNLKADLGNHLIVPEEAVLFAGQDRVVFKDLGEGHLTARKVETGQRNENYIEILAGLQSGDKVVTSGNFLIASETQLKTGIKQW